MRSELHKAFAYLYMISILIAGCTQKNRIGDDTYFNSKVMILGHRGMGSGYYKPDNTLEAIVPVLNIGADGAEIDIQMTRDSVLVLFHDEELAPSTTCKGRIYEQSWEEVRQCKYYALQNMVFVNSLESVFNALPHLKDLYFSFDCKTDDLVHDKEAYVGQYLRAIRRACEKYDMTDHVLIEGKEDLLIKAQEYGLQNKLFMSCVIDEENIQRAAGHHFFGIAANRSDLAHYVDMAHLQGLWVMAFTPNSYTENKKTIEQKVDIIQSDDPMSALKLLGRFNYEYVIP